MPLHRLEEWSRKNPEKRRAGRRRNSRARQEWLESLKCGPCTDCGHLYPPECMDFDHVAGTKVASASRLLRTASKARVIAEVKKCDLVCANCHRIRTRARQKKVTP